MGGNKLSARLGYIRKQKNRKPQPADSGGRGGNGGAGPEGWIRAGTYTLVREEEIPFEHPEVFTPDPILQTRVPADKLLFFDTETTGLSGGAGTVAFLLGTAVMRNQRLTVKQFLLTDFPGEEEYLRETLKTFSSDFIYVSYNGKSFDSHLLASRYVMNRLSFSFPLQLDLLYPARRLWGSVLPSCSLSTIEQEVLSIRRENDVPGWEIPFTYFRFLETKDFTELLPVAGHNLQDLLSLARLFVRMKEIFSNPREPGRIDRFSLGRMLLEQGDPAGLEILHAASDGGDIRAGRYLGRYYKRSSQHTEAFRLWERLWKEKSDPAAGIELAKYFEHRAKDCKSALRIAEAVYTGCPFSSGEERAVLHRIRRLERKLEGEEQKKR